MRFDEIELEAVPLIAPPSPPPADEERSPRMRRLLALLTDLSLFAALSLALSPLLPDPHGWPEIAALAGFVVVISYYYFVGAWMLWGKTIGGAIFDVRVVSRTLRDASKRWSWIFAGAAIAGAIVMAVMR